MRGDPPSRLEQVGLSQVIAFVRVVDARSFTAAARQLGLSKATISKRVAHLEGHLGASLLRRTTRSLSTTEDGARFYAHCTRILEELAAAESDILISRNTVRGSIRVHAPCFFGNQRIVPALQGFMDRHPGIDIDLSLHDEIDERAGDGADIAIRVGRNSVAGRRSVRFAPIVRIVCAAPAYLVRFGEPQAPSDLVAHNCLRLGPGRHGDTWCMDGPGGPRNVTVSGRFRANSPAALRLAVLSGLGLALMPEAMVADDIAAGHLVAVLPAFQDRSEAWYLDYPNGRGAAPAVRSVAAFLQGLVHMPSSAPAASTTNVPEHPHDWFKDLEHDAIV